MSERLTPAEYEVLLRHDFATFAMRCFHDLNPQTRLAMNWHLEVIAAKLTAVREGKIRRLIINVAPRHLKSLLASIAFPAWCLGPWNAGFSLTYPASYCVGLPTFWVR